MFQKFKTLLQILTERRRWSELRQRGLRNIRQFRLNVAGGRAFVYNNETLPRKFACLPLVETSRALYLDRGFDDIECQIAAAWLTKNDIAIDVGANMGAYSVAFAEAVGPNGIVISVEAGEKTACELRQAIELLTLNQVKVVNECVCDVVGNETFLVSADGGADLCQGIKSDRDDSNSYREVIVRATTLDALVERFDSKLATALVKIDIEGAEPRALRGAKTLFDRDNPPMFLLEAFERMLQRFEYSLDDIFRFFSPSKYEAYLVNRGWPDNNERFPFGQLHPLPMPRPSHYRLPWHCNVIFVPTGDKIRMSRVAPLLKRTRSQ